MMNKKFGINLAAGLAGIFTLFSCEPPSDSTDKTPELTEFEFKEKSESRRQKPISDGVIGSLSDLKVELEKVAQGEDKSRVLESALIHSENLDATGEKWNGTSTILATRFIDLFPSGNPNPEFFDKFGLAGHDSEQKPKVEVELLVRTIGTLASNRPDLLQEFLARKAKDATQAESDLVVYGAALESVMEYSGVFRRIGYGGIASLHESGNPIYRLLGAKLMPLLEHDLYSLGKFYRPYMAERDETLLLAAIDGLATAGTPEALGMLQEFAASNREVSTNVAASAKRAVELVAARQTK